jgi:hypothetical protein
MIPQVPLVPITRNGIIILFINGQNPLKSKPRFASPVHLNDRYMIINARMKFGTAAPIKPIKDEI